MSRESINKQPITTHLSVKTSQSEYTYKVLPIRRQGQILTLVQICCAVRSVNCRGQPKVSLSLSLSLLFSLFVALLLGNLRHPGKRTRKSTQAFNLRLVWSPTCMDLRWLWSSSNSYACICWRFSWPLVSKACEGNNATTYIRYKCFICPKTC